MTTPTLSAAEAADVLLTANGQVRAIHTRMAVPAYTLAQTSASNVRVAYSCLSPDTAVSQAAYAAVLFADAGWRVFREAATATLEAVPPTAAVSACSHALGPGGASLDDPLTRVQWDQYGKVAVAGLWVTDHSHGNAPVRITWSPTNAQNQVGNDERLEGTVLAEREGRALGAATALLQAQGWTVEQRTLSGQGILFATAPQSS